MNKAQWITLVSAVLLFAGLYLGAGTKPKERKAVEKSRALTTESLDIEELLAEAKKTLPPTVAGEVAAAEQQFAEAAKEADKVAIFKNLSHIWYEQKRAELAGHYAQKVAELENTDAAWFTAGATFRTAAQQAENEKLKQFCNKRTLKAFENALSLDPTSATNKLNLATCYADNPPADNPMKGILMLRELNEQEPDNVAVLNTLGRLAIQTSQFDKAILRLERAVSLSPKNKASVCLLAEAYEGAQNTAKAAEFAAKCQEIK